MKKKMVFISTLILILVLATASGFAQEGEPIGTNSPDDYLISDDLIVTGDQCLGFDCVNGESFNNADSLKLKENNIQIYFDDTSTVEGFSKNDWRILINETTNPGESFFAIQDATAGRTPFKIMAGAVNGALVVDADGRVIVWNNVNDANLLVKGDITPAMRLEQDGSYYPAQIWDIAGDEHYFTILDVTGGQPQDEGILTLETGAPRNSLYVNDAGYIGLGTNDPQHPLDIKSGDDVLAQLDSSGNLTLSGLLTEASDRKLKENFKVVDGGNVLDRIAAMPITSWNFISDEADSRHIGPVAQDFYAAFGLGVDDQHIAPLDANGVALAGVQELHQQLLEKDAEIEALESRLTALEQAAGTESVPNWVWLLVGALGITALAGLGVLISLVRRQMVRA